MSDRLAEIGEELKWPDERDRENEHYLLKRLRAAEKLVKFAGHNGKCKSLYPRTARGYAPCDCGLTDDRKAWEKAK